MLARIAATIEARRKGADPAESYVASLFAKGDDAILKKIGEEATETVMAAKDGETSGSPPKSPTCGSIASCCSRATGWARPTCWPSSRDAKGRPATPRKARAERRARRPAGGAGGRFLYNRGSGRRRDGRRRAQAKDRDAGPGLHLLQDRQGRDPGRKVYEDDDMLAFHDIQSGGAGAFHADPEESNRVAVRRHAADAPALGQDDGAGRHARARAGPTDGFRTIVNTGRVGRQEVSMSTCT